MNWNRFAIEFRNEPKVQVLCDFNFAETITKCAFETVLSDLSKDAEARQLKVLDGGLTTAAHLRDWLCVSHRCTELCNSVTIFGAASDRGLSFHSDRLNRMAVMAEMTSGLSHRCWASLSPIGSVIIKSHMSWATKNDGRLVRPKPRIGSVVRSHIITLRYQSILTCKACVERDGKLHDKYIYSCGSADWTDSMSRRLVWRSVSRVDKTWVLTRIANIVESSESSESSH